jgi:hypothetical protein
MNELRDEFPRLVDALKITAGQDALQELIYKICSNYRRRLRNKQRNPSKAVEISKRGGISCPHRDHVHIDSRSTETSGLVPSASKEDLPWSLLSVIRPNGVVYVLCALHDLAPSWSESDGDISALIDGLSFETLLGFLEKDHSYRRGVDRLACVDFKSKERRGMLMVEDESQLRAVVTRMLPYSSMIFQIIGNVVE